MTAGQLSDLPPWSLSLIWSVVSLLAAYLMGQVITRVVCQRLSRWAAKTTWGWDALIIDALRKGIPLWSLLVGGSVAIGFWSLPAHLMRALHNAIYVLVWLSITIVCAGLVGKHAVNTS